MDEELQGLLLLVDVLVVLVTLALHVGGVAGGHGLEGVDSQPVTEPLLDNGPVNLVEKKGSARRKRRKVLTAFTRKEYLAYKRPLNL